MSQPINILGLSTCQVLRLVFDELKASPAAHVIITAHRILPDDDPLLYGCRLLTREFPRARIDIVSDHAAPAS